MDATQYYITTLTNAALKIGPMIFYLLAGYFLFIKLPFLIYYRSLKKSQGPLDGEQSFEQDIHFQKRMEEERKKEFEERMKNLGKNKEKGQNKEQRQEQTNQDKKTQKKRSEPIKATPEEILFKLRPGEVFTGQELKKRYHELLKQSHPDKFRTDHQKEYAEAKTKNINEAYQKLKKRVT